MMIEITFDYAFDYKHKRVAAIICVPKKISKYGKLVKMGSKKDFNQVAKDCLLVLSYETRTLLSDKYFKFIDEGVYKFNVEEIK